MIIDRWRIKIKSKCPTGHLLQLVEKVLLPSSRTFLEFSIISLGVL